MKCCVHCFRDNDLIERISSLHQRGNCDFCEHQDVYVLDIEFAKKNQDYAQNFVSDFGELIDQFTSEYPRKFTIHAHKMADALVATTSIFNLSALKVEQLLYELLEERVKLDQEIFNQLVVPRYLLNQQFMNAFGIFNGKHWKDFENDIKFKNRFHSKAVNEEQLVKFFSQCIVAVKPTKRLVRARKSPDGKPIDFRNMGAAPNGMATAGRLNAAGIGYLYLSESREIALAEIKAATTDICTVATFEVLNKDLRVVNLSDISKLSFFAFQDQEKSSYLMNRDDLNQIDQAMRRMSGSERSEIKYVPTEYMSDLIKSMGVDGIAYDSSLDPDTKDYVLFNDDKVKQIVDEKVTYRISAISYEKSKV